MSIHLVLGEANAAISIVKGESVSLLFEVSDHHRHLDGVGRAAHGLVDRTVVMGAVGVVVLKRIVSGTTGEDHVAMRTDAVETKHQLVIALAGDHGSATAG